MKLKAFRYSYEDYFRVVESSIFPGIKICEIGPSGKPTIKSSIIRKRKLDYTIIDIETIHWKDYDKEVGKFEIDLQNNFDCNLENQFDLVISQMVLEHIEYPKLFHKNIYRLIKKGGSAIHLYANPNSLSALANKILPEKVGQNILRLIKNRNLIYDQKYVGYYRWCFIPGKKAKNQYETIGFTVKDHVSYLGHNYLQKVPLLNQLEKWYGLFLLKLRLKKISTLSLLHVKKQ